MGISLKLQTRPSRSKISSLTSWTYSSECAFIQVAGWKTCRRTCANLEAHRWPSAAKVVTRDACGDTLRCHVRTERLPYVGSGDVITVTAKRGSQKFLTMSWKVNFSWLRSYSAVGKKVVPTFLCKKSHLIWHFYISLTLSQAQSTSPYRFPITHLRRNFRDDLPFNLKRDYPSGLEKSGASH